MAHNCVDWTVNPPVRKTPLLILTRGDDHVYTTIPNELKVLQDVAKREFNLGNVEINFCSSCLSFCHGLPARITESAWEHIRPYIGCATVEVSSPKAEPPQGVSREEQPTAFQNTEHEHDSHVKQKPLSNSGEGYENEQFDHGPGKKLTASPKGAVRDEQSALSVHGNDRDTASVPEDQNRHEEPWEEEEEVSAVPPRTSRNRRRVVSEYENEGEESEREHKVPAGSQVPPSASPKPSKGTKKERESGYRSQPDSQSAEPLPQPSKLIKQEKHTGGSGSRSRPYSRDGHSQFPRAGSRHEVQAQGQLVESSEIHKLMIRIAHRPSKQESMFTTKSTTKVTKVLAAACKSFGLDATRATLHLIVLVEDEDGEVENLFPCDKNDTIARAGAERDTESRFLLKMAGEA